MCFAETIYKFNDIWWMFVFLDRFRISNEWMDLHLCNASLNDFRTLWNLARFYVILTCIWFNILKLRDRIFDCKKSITVNSKLLTILVLQYHFSSLHHQASSSIFNKFYELKPVNKLTKWAIVDTSTIFTSPMACASIKIH